MTGSDQAKNPVALEDLSLEEFLAHAHAIETEAWERYEDLADQMAVHNNPKVADLFRRLGDFERRHAQKIEASMQTLDIPRIAPWDFNWTGTESPEAIDFTEAHYRMTPYHALRLALVSEQRAYAFFSKLAQSATEEAVRKLAGEYAREELRHVQMVGELLAQQPEPAKDWADDMDPAMIVE
ncbi:MAG: ferritin family protein [Sphingomonadales bacterium]